MNVCLCVCVSMCVLLDVCRGVWFLKRLFIHERRRSQTASIAFTAACSPLHRTSVHVITTSTHTHACNSACITTESQLCLSYNYTLCILNVVSLGLPVWMWVLHNTIACTMTLVFVICRQFQPKTLDTIDKLLHKNLAEFLQGCVWRLIVHCFLKNLVKSSVNISATYHRQHLSQHQSPLHPKSTR